MSEQRLYLMEYDIEDDPAYFSDGRVLLLAPHRVEARREGRKAAIAAYYESAGGWALKPKVIIHSCKRFALPEDGVVMITSPVSYR